MSLARHTAYNMAGWIAPVLVSLISVPLYLRLIGLERYGLLAVCWGLLGFMSFLSLGMGPAIAQRLASQSSTVPEQPVRLFWSAIALNIAMASFAGVCVLAFGHLYFDAVRIANQDLRAEIRDAIPWLAVSFAVSITSGVLTGTLQGRQWFGALSLQAVLSAPALAVVPLIAAWVIAPTLPVLIGATLGVNLASFLCLFVLCTRAVPITRLTRPSRALMRDLASFGGWVTMTSLIAPAVMLLDRFVIAARLGSAAVSTYVIPYNLVSRIIMIPSSLSTAAMPRFAAAAEMEADRLQNVGLAFLLSTLTPLCVLGSIIMAPFLTVWVGASVAEPAAPVGCALVFGFWMHGVGHVPSTIVTGRGRPDLLTKLLVATTVPYFLVLYVLLDQVGILGAAIAWSLRTSFDLALFYFTNITRKQIVQVGASSLLVLASCVGSAGLDWRDWTYWLVNGTILAIAAPWAWAIAPVSPLDLIKRFARQPLRS